MSGSATPAAASPATSGTQARHQSQPSATSVTPATQTECGDVWKCHACHAKRRWMSPGKVVYVKDGVWQSCVTQRARKEEARRRTGYTEPKTRTPHTDVGQKHAYMNCTCMYRCRDKHDVWWYVVSCIDLSICIHIVVDKSFFTHLRRFFAVWMLLSRTSTLSLRGRMWDDSVSSEGWTPSLPSRLLHDSLVDMQVASRQTLPYWVCDCKARRDTLQSALSHTPVPLCHPSRNSCKHQPACSYNLHRPFANKHVAFASLKTPWIEKRYDRSSQSAFLTRTSRSIPMCVE